MLEMNTLFQIDLKACSVEIAMIQRGLADNTSPKRLIFTVRRPETDFEGMDGQALPISMDQGGRPE